MFVLDIFHDESKKTPLQVQGDAGGVEARAARAGRGSTDRVSRTLSEY